jgi:hypothetical protein
MKMKKLCLTSIPDSDLSLQFALDVITSLSQLAGNLGTFMSDLIKDRSLAMVN